MELLPETRRRALRYRAKNGLVISFTNHALKRLRDRRIDPEQRLGEIQGKPLREYRRHGVVANYRPSINHLTIITVW